MAGESKVIDQLARDLKAEFPDMQGFSPRNLKYMRALAQAWPTSEIVQQAVAQLPWSHVVTLLDKVKDPATRNWYAGKSLEHGRSRNVLAMQIDTQAHARAGSAVTNFSSSSKRRHFGPNTPVNSTFTCQRSTRN